MWSLSMLKQHNNQCNSQMAKTIPLISLALVQINEQCNKTIKTFTFLCCVWPGPCVNDDRNTSFTFTTSFHGHTEKESDIKIEWKMFGKLLGIGDVLTFSNIYISRREIITCLNNWRYSSKVGEKWLGGNSEGRVSEFSSVFWWKLWMDDEE